MVSSLLGSVVLRCGFVVADLIVVGLQNSFRAIVLTLSVKPKRLFLMV